MKVICFSEVMSPITHMSGTVGNEAIISREQTVSGHWVPTLSGNALRHRCIREPGARYLVEALGLEAKLSLPQLGFLFNGGALTESTGREDTNRIAECQRLFPLLKLLGGSLPDQILSGTLISHNGTLFCEENRRKLEYLLPEEWPLPELRLRDAESMVGGYQYVRGVPTKSAAQFIHADSQLVRDEDGHIVKDKDGNAVRPRGSQKGDKSQQMIFSGQCVLRGSAFVHGFLSPSATELELGCLLNSLNLWQQAGGTVGGAAGKGHGQLMSYFHVSDIDTDPNTDLIQYYQDYVEHNKADCIDWLMSAFREKKAAA